MPLGNPETSTGSANIISSATSPFSLRVIPRDQHTISRKDISPNALRVLYRLRDAGQRVVAAVDGEADRSVAVGRKRRTADLPRRELPAAEENRNASGTPHELTRRGHEVFVQAGAGLGSSITDAEYADQDQHDGQHVEVWERF